MAKAFQPQIMTGNDLIEGESLFLGPAGWTHRVAEARVARTPEEAAALAAEAEADEAANHVVGVYAVAVTLEDGHPRPLARRERIRAAGEPTIPYGPGAPVARRAAA